MPEKTLTVAEIAKLVGGQVVGNGDVRINRISSLDRATEHDVSFLSNPKFEDQLDTTLAGCVLLSDSRIKQGSTNAVLCSDPYLAFALVAQALDNTPRPADMVSPEATVDPSSQIGNNVTLACGVVIQKNCIIGDGTSIGANTHVGEGTTIGKDCTIYANVSIYHQVNIGRRCILHSGVVIGSDGFGYANDKGQWIKIPQTGQVEIGEDVEIGANSTIDRGALNDTVIGNGVKIDNLCHIAHNVEVGEHTAMAAYTAIAGSSKIGKSCTFSGRSSIIGHLSIAAGTHLTACTLVNKSNDKAAVFSSGTGAQENKLWRKNVARFKQLDEMAKKLRQLEKKLEKLQGD